MSAVFIAGSISIKHLNVRFLERIQNIISKNLDILLGDAPGIDSLVQQYLREQKYKKVKIYCSGLTPRNNFGNWEIIQVKSSFAKGTRAFFTAKDLKLAEDANFGLMCWDTKSTGTLSNIYELLSKGKKTIVYINNTNNFLSLAKIEDFNFFLKSMSHKAFTKANAKINLTKKIDQLKFNEKLFAS
jgi:hypothetical protein